MSSAVAFTGGIVGPHYAATKAGLIGLMHSLATLLAPYGITVNVAALAPIESDALRDIDTGTRLINLRRVPMGRLGQAG
jgi:3-oxoacyl-[acyl-carrier protein] reductase